jgi:hypothetical protein
MLTFTVSREEFSKHLSARLEYHRGKLVNTKRLIKELLALVKRIKTDMKKSKRSADKFFRVKGEQANVLYALGLAGESGPQGCAGAEGSCGPTGYVDFRDESDLLGMLERKHSQLKNEESGLMRKLHAFGFYLKHLGQEIYELDRAELVTLEFTAFQ